MHFTAGELTTKFSLGFLIIQSIDNFDKTSNIFVISFIEKPYANFTIIAEMTKMKKYLLIEDETQTKMHHFYICEKSS